MNLLSFTPYYCPYTFYNANETDLIQDGFAWCNKKEEIQQKLSIYIFTGNGMRTERVHRHPIIIHTLCITLFSSK